VESLDGRIFIAQKNTALAKKASSRVPQRQDAARHAAVLPPARSVTVGSVRTDINAPRATAINNGRGLDIIAEPLFAVRHAPADTLGGVPCMERSVITRIAGHTAGVVKLVMLQISLLKQEDAARPAHAMGARRLGRIDVVIVRDAYTQMVSARLVER